MRRREFITMSSTQPGRTDETRRHLHYVLRMGNTVPLTYWVGRASELGALLKERLQTLGNPFAFLDEIGNALSQVTGGDKSASAVNLSSSNIVTLILSVLTPVVSETLIFLVALVFNLIYHRDIQSGMLLPFHNDSARQMAKDVLKDIQVSCSVGRQRSFMPYCGECWHISFRI